VAGDSFFLTLFLVIVFHQFFEGVALGSRLATVGTSEVPALANIGCSHHFSPHDHRIPMQESSSDGSVVAEPSLDQIRSSGGCIMTRHEAATDVPSIFPMWKKLLYASLFTLVTPAGMAIGIAVLNTFNGNDPATIVVIGGLDAFSAGILVWVGVVEMWAGDWMGGEMSTSSPLMTGLGLLSLVGGMALMSLLGKWA
jgi:zinc transporter 1/2/3